MLNLSLCVYKNAKYPLADMDVLGAVTECVVLRWSTASASQVKAFSASEDPQEWILAPLPPPSKGRRYVHWPTLKMAPHSRRGEPVSGVRPWSNCASTKDLSANAPRGERIRYFC